MSQKGLAKREWEWCRDNPVSRIRGKGSEQSHTFATRLVQSGVELYKVQRLLGHKSPLMTQRYAHHYPESLRDGVESLDRHAQSDTKFTTAAVSWKGGVSQVLEEMVGDTGIEPVASSV